MTPFETWWTDQVASAWFSWNDARSVLKEMEENEPVTLEVFTVLDFKRYLLDDMKAVVDAFRCLRQFKRQPDINCPSIPERQAATLIERLQTTLRRVWFWIHVMKLDDSVRWSRHALMFRAELVRRGYMAYNAPDWPEPLPKVYGMYPPRRGSTYKRRASPLTPRPPIEALKKKKRAKK